MDTATFKKEINRLNTEQLQNILDGDRLIIYQDKKLAINHENCAYVIYELGDDTFSSVEKLTAYLLNNHAPLLEEYYKFNPLSKEFFNLSITHLISENDDEAFISHPEVDAKLKIFVDNGTLVTEDVGSQRFKYGINLKLKEKMPERALLNQLRNWVQSGTAYNDYISVNVCRFSSID